MTEYSENLHDAARRYLKCASVSQKHSDAVRASMDCTDVPTADRAMVNRASSVLEAMQLVPGEFGEEALKAEDGTPLPLRIWTALMRPTPESERAHWIILASCSTADAECQASRLRLAIKSVEEEEMVACRSGLARA